MRRRHRPPRAVRAAEYNLLFDAPGPKTRRNFRLINIAAILLILLVLFLVGQRLHALGQMDASMWRVVVQRSSWVNYLLPGLWHTVSAAAVAIVGALIFGLLFGVGRLSQNPAVRWASGGIVEFFRAVPVLLMMIFLWSFLPVFYKGLNLTHPPDPSFVAVVTALILYNGSVCADLVRSGVQNLPSGQHEAAAAIGLRPYQALQYVLVPQALLAMLPALIAQLVVALKDSALGYLISYSELLNMAKLLGTPLRTLQTLTVAAVIFILINYGLGKLGEKLARRMRSRTSPLDEETAEDMPINVTSQAVADMLEPVDKDGYELGPWRVSPGQVRSQWAAAPQVPGVRRISPGEAL